MSGVLMLCAAFTATAVGAAGAAPTAGSQPGTAAAKPTVTVKRAISYGPGLVDIYAVKDGVPNKPAMVLVHGGGWDGGTRQSSWVTAPSKDFAKHGFVAFSIDYPLATDTQQGTPVQENAVIAAVDWVKANSVRFGIDPTRVGTIGGSAGGQLSMQAGLLGNAGLPGRIKVSLSMSGPVDLWTPIADLQAVPPDDTTPYLPGYHNLEMYLGCPYAECTRQQAEAASPLYSINPDCPPIYITRGREEDIEGAQVFVDALEANSCSGTLQVVDSKEHGFHHWADAKKGVFKYLATIM